MQRSITHQKFIAKFIFFISFVIYESLSSIYLFLPPLFALLYILMHEAFRKKDYFSLFFITLSLMVFEADKGYLTFSAVIYFLLIYRFIMPKMIQNFSCRSCINILYVIFAYFGFFIFSQLLSHIFLVDVPGINNYILFYMVLEFFILSIL